MAFRCLTRAFRQGLMEPGLAISRSSTNRQSFSRFRECVYCGGKAGRLEADHVPPKGLFQRPLPPTTLTVPACGPCHASFKKNDDYFRIALTISDRAKGNPERDAVLPVALQGLNHTRASGLRRTIMDSSFLTDAVTESGIYLGRRRALSFDAPRLNATAARVVKGLHAIERGARVADEMEVHVLPVGRFRGLDAVHPEIALVRMEFIALLQQEPMHQQREVFAYQ